MKNVKGFIDADGHVVESDAELLDFLPTPYHGRSDLLAFPFFPTLDGFHRQARRVADGKGRYIAKGSLKEWQEFLDEDQIAWSVLYPTAGLTFGLIRDKDWACAVAAGYNNYLYETFTKPEKRLKGMALIPLQSIPDAVKELKRAVKELGFVGAVLPAVGLRQPFGDQKYFPVYEAAEKLGALLAERIIEGSADILVRVFLSGLENPRSGGGEEKTCEIFYCDACSDENVFGGNLELGERRHGQWGFAL